jgi:hypothetical protein
VTDSIQPVPIRCKCGNQIAVDVYIEGNVLVHAGGGLWYVMRGYCDKCGESFNLSIKERQIQRAIITRSKLGDQEKG